MLNTSSWGRNSADRQTTQPTPGYTKPYCQAISSLLAHSISGASYLVARYVDGDDVREAEVPFQIGYDKGRNEATTRGVNMYGCVHTPFHEKVVDCLHRFVLSRLSPRVSHTGDYYEPHHSRVQEASDMFQVLTPFKARSLTIPQKSASGVVSVPWTGLRCPA